ncbi:MAG: hypothetical protein V3W41_22045 [Planctomycetota bacterium]
MSKSRGAASAGGAPKEPQWEPSPPDAIKAWLEGKGPAEFAALEQEGRPLYPEAIHRHNPKSGNMEQIDVMLRVPTTMEQLRARTNTLDYLQQHAGLDARPTKVECEALWGEDYFDNTDTVFLLELCVLDVEPLANGVRPPYMRAEFLDKMHPRASLHAIYERLNFYQAIEDPRVTELTEEQFGQTVAAIAKQRNLSPLVVIDGRAHASFVISMAERLTTFLTAASG